MLKSKLTQKIQIINLALYSQTVAKPKVFQVDNTNDSNRIREPCLSRIQIHHMNQRRIDQNITAASSENHEYNVSHWTFSIDKIKRLAAASENQVSQDKNTKFIT